MAKFKYSVTQKIMASIEVEVEADNEEEGRELGREKAFSIPLFRDWGVSWQTDDEILDEEIEEKE